MNKEIFIEKKDNLVKVALKYLAKDNLSTQDRISLTKALEILSEYSFENRLQKKGLLSHTIIDSLELDYSIGEKFIEFDNSIK